MLIKIGNRFELYPHKVKYIQHGEEIEQWALPNKQWWIDFEQKWEHTQIIEFIELELTEEQLQRFEEINNYDISEGFREICIDYILEGIFPTDIKHPLRELQLGKELANLKNENILKDNKIITLEGGIMELTMILAMGGM